MKSHFGIGHDDADDITKSLSKILQKWFTKSVFHIGCLSGLGSRDLRLATFREIHLPSSRKVEDVLHVDEASFNP